MHRINKGRPLEIVHGAFRVVGAKGLRAKHLALLGDGSAVDLGHVAVEERKLTPEEMQSARAAAEERGLYGGDRRPLNYIYNDPRFMVSLPKDGKRPRRSTSPTGSTTDPRSEHTQPAPLMMQGNFCASVKGSGSVERTTELEFEAAVAQAKKIWPKATRTSSQGRSSQNVKSGSR